MAAMAEGLSFSTTWRPPLHTRRAQIQVSPGLAASAPRPMKKKKYGSLEGDFLATAPRTPLRAPHHRIWRCNNTRKPGHGEEDLSVWAK